jgi:hypothetical protein
MGFAALAAMFACSPDSGPGHHHEPVDPSTLTADTDTDTDSDTDIDTDTGPLLGSMQWGVGATQDRAWIQQYGGDAPEETFAIAVGPEGTFIAGTTQSSWYRTFEDPCTDVEHAVARDCGDAVLFDTDTMAGIQTGGLASDEVRGMAVHGGEVTFGGRSRSENSWVMGAYVSRYLTDLTTVVWETVQPHSELLGLYVDRDKVFTAGGTLYEWQPPEPNYGDEDGLALKLGVDGDVETVQQIGSTEFDELHDVRADTRGVYITGLTQGVLGAENHGGEDAILIVWPQDLDDANELCRVQIGTSRRDGAEGVVASGDFIYVGGNTEGQINGEQANGSACYLGGEDFLPDAWIAKYDRSCNMVWTRQFGGVQGDAVEAIAVDDQYVYATGYANAGTDHEEGPRALTNDGFVRAYTFDGDLVGEVIFDGSLGVDDPRVDYARAITVDATNVYVGGATDGEMGDTPNAGERDIFLATIPKDELIGNVRFEGDGCPEDPTGTPRAR